MNARKLITLVAFVTVIGWATAFMPSKALAQWSDGGPEMYPLTYPAETVEVKSELRMPEVSSDTVQTADALPPLWSDGGPERYPLTFPAKTVAKKTGLRVTEVPCKTVQTAEALPPLWSDGGPERYPLTYATKTTATDYEICLAK